MARVAAGDDPWDALRASGAARGPKNDGAARQEIERARRFGARVLTFGDEDFPPLLRASPCPPPLLYVWGTLRPEDVFAVSVIGSRRATAHGEAVAQNIARGLAGHGFVVVSGLARGIDAAGHRGALAAGGRTLAVLGSGLDRVYPPEHRDLAAAIAGRGAVLSELPFGTPPLKQHFPERNRLIAWISWATVVVEATRDSGSLITANLAVDQGRTVYAVPGRPGEPNAEGTNALLREGALVCRCAGDVVEDLAPQLVDAARSSIDARGNGIVIGTTGVGPAEGVTGVPGDLRLTPGQRRVFESLPATGGIGIERLGAESGLAPGTLLATLLELELLGLVRSLPGRRFSVAGVRI